MLGMMHLEHQSPYIDGLTENDRELIPVVRLSNVCKGAPAEGLHCVAILCGCGEDNDWQSGIEVF
jgi:hypothetical protein